MTPRLPTCSPGWGAPVAILLGSVAAGLVGCAEDPSAPDPVPVLEVPSGLVLSEPEGGVKLSGDAVSSKEPPVAYVSAAPGTFADGTRIEIRNSTTGYSGTPAIVAVEGGFDPVAVAASAGDELQLEIQTAGLHSLLLVTVPENRPPLVVRTDPPKGRTDVAFTTRPLVIFSEPMDPRSVTDATMQLLHNGSAVPAMVALVPESPFAAQIVPDALLQPSTTYELVVTTAVRDLEGDALEGELRITFVTSPPRLSNQIVFSYHVPGVWEPGDIYAMDADGSTLTQLTDHPANDLEAAISPDGSKVLFMTDRDGNFEIYVMDASGSGLVNLTNDPADDLSPEWSPDGTKIAFASAGVSADGCDVVNDIFVMNADGSNRLNVTRSPGVLEGQPAWSPDGTRIAFFGGDWCRGEMGTGERHIWVMNIDGSGRVDLTPQGPRPATAPAWSPDGSRIAFWGHHLGDVFDPAYDVPDIFVMNADGSGLSGLIMPTFPLDYEGGSPHGAPAWSPDGSRILFSGWVGSWGLFTIRPDGLDVMAVTLFESDAARVGSSQAWIR